MATLDTLKSLLGILRAYADDQSKHPILDHPDKYQFNKEDHHWHLKELISTDRAGNTVKTPALFGHEDGIGIGSQSADYEFGKALKNGWNVEKSPEGHDVLLAPDEEDLKALNSAYATVNSANHSVSSDKGDAPPGPLSAKVKALGHTAGFFTTYAGGKHLHPDTLENLSYFGGEAPYMDGFTKGAIAGHLAGGQVYAQDELSDTLPMAKVKDFVAPTNDSAPFLQSLGGEPLPDSAENLGAWLEQKGHISDEYDVKWHEAQTAHGKAIEDGIDEDVADDWKDNWVGHPHLEDASDVQNWMEYHSHYPSSGEEKKEAYDFAVEHGIPTDALDDWRYTHMAAAMAGTGRDLMEWAESAGYDLDDFDSFNDAMRDAKGQGADEDVIGELVDHAYNNNQSEGGLVDDSEYENRIYDPAKARAGVVDAISDVIVPDGMSREEALSARLMFDSYKSNGKSEDKLREGEIKAHRRFLELNPDLEESRGTPEQAADKRMGLFHRYREAVDNQRDTPTPSSILSDQDGKERLLRAFDAETMFHSRHGQMDWANSSGSAMGISKTLSWLKTEATPEQQERFYADAARYMDRCTDPEQARFVLSDNQKGAMSWLDDGEYQYKRFTTVPDGDYNTRTEREHRMQIGRVNYAALGFEAALPPVIGGMTPLSDLQGGRVADFRTQGYGDTRFAFEGVGTSSHAVNDTYMDASYCPDGGYRSLIPNAASFARHQSDYGHFSSPTMGASSHGPNFLELHPRDLKAEKLRQVQMYGLTTAAIGAADGPGELKPQHIEFIHKVLEKSPAQVLISPQGAPFYHSGVLAVTPYRETPEALPTITTEQEARENIERAQEYLQDTFKARGFSDADAARVQLYLPEWYRK